MTPSAFPLEINLSIELEGRARRFARAANRAISEATGSLFRFEGPGAVIPHITLLMGTVPDRATLAAVIRGAERLLARTPTPRYQLLDPHLVPGGLVFAGVAPQGGLRRLRRQLARTVADRMSLHEWGGPDSESHVTLAVVPAGADGAAERALTLVPRHRVTARATSIQVARVGDYGTCVEQLVRFGLSSTRPC